MTRTHTVPAGTMASALLASGVTTQLAFDTDLVDALRNVKHDQMRTRVMPRVAFACDAHINIAVQRALNALRVEKELEGAQSWDSYQAFLNYAAGIAASDQTLAEAGMQVDDLRDTVQKLYNVRTQIHDLMHAELGEKYVIPNIVEWMTKPRLRRDDATTLMKRRQSATIIATNGDGVIDVEMERQLLESMTMKDAAEKEDALKWDQHRGKLAAMLFNALKIRDDMADIGYVGEHEEPFLDLDPLPQYKLIESAIRAITNVVTIDLVKDRKVGFEDHAAAAIESRPLIKQLKLALEHRRFKDLEV